MEKALWAVPLAMPVSRQIVLQDRPRARRAAILAASTVTLGRPILLPLALAFLMPAWAIQKFNCGGSQEDLGV